MENELAQRAGIDDDQAAYCHCATQTAGGQWQKEMAQHLAPHD
jgi:hypothetical protein